jgi:histone-lysine N-methyltransferase SETMAR
MDSSLRARDEKTIHGVLSAGKIMATVFWDWEGVILTDMLPSDQTINSDVYVETLKKLKKRFWRVRSHKDVTKVLLHHDNARPHTSLRTERPSQSFSGLSCLIHLTAQIWLLPTTIFSVP